ncbi:MAG TPA: restriction endonuclease [Armatimonadaceae bacterium]|nr:restriction endonuclease [Armatimonadaceae bacterium]
MPVPDVTSLRLPFLRCVADGKPHSFDEVCSLLAAEFKLPEAEKQAMRCQAGSVRALLVREGLLEAITSKEFRATRAGLAHLKASVAAPAPTPKQVLPEKGTPLPRPSPVPSAATVPVPAKAATPAANSGSAIHKVFEQAECALAGQVKHHLKTCSPVRFEQIVVDLLAAMGYASVRAAEPATVVGGPGDGGIDGILHPDPLGFSPVYVQAKKRDGNGLIGSPEVRGFLGALQTRGASRGVFVTSGRFSDDALAVCGSPLPNCRVVLIDGDQLVRYLIEYKVGVVVRATYEVKEVDAGYFAEPPQPSI